MACFYPRHFFSDFPIYWDDPSWLIFTDEKELKFMDNYWKTCFGESQTLAELKVKKKTLVERYADVLMEGPSTSFN